MGTRRRRGWDRARQPRGRWWRGRRLLHLSLRSLTDTAETAGTRLGSDVPELMRSFGVAPRRNLRPCCACRGGSSTSSSSPSTPSRPATAELPGRSLDSCSREGDLGFGRLVSLHARRPPSGRDPGRAGAVPRDCQSQLSAGEALGLLLVIGCRLRVAFGSRGRVPRPAQALMSPGSRVVVRAGQSRHCDQVAQTPGGRSHPAADTSGGPATGRRHGPALHSPHRHPQEATPWRNRTCD